MLLGQLCIPRPARSGQRDGSPCTAVAAGMAQETGVPGDLLHLDLV